MAYASHMENLSPRTFCILVSKSTTSCSMNTSYVSDFIHKILVQLTGTNFMCNVNYPKFPYRICAKNVHDKDKAIQCDLCEFWIHIKYNNLIYLDYRYNQNCDESCY